MRRSACPDARLMSIDLPGGRFGAGYEPESLPLLRALPLKGQDLSLVRANSHHSRTREQVVQWMGGDQLDFVLIDGDHSYDGVRTDFEMYARYVRPGGFVAFH